MLCLRSNIPITGVLMERLSRILEFVDVAWRVGGVERGSEELMGLAWFWFFRTVQLRDSYSMNKDDPSSDEYEPIYLGRIYK